MIACAQRADKKEKRGNELPEGLAAKAEAPGARDSWKAAEQARKIAEREAGKQTSGKKKQKHEPKEPDPTPREAKANIAGDGKGWVDRDPCCRGWASRDGGVGKG